MVVVGYEPQVEVVVVSTVRVVVASFVSEVLN